MSVRMLLYEFVHMCEFRILVSLMDGFPVSFIEHHRKQDKENE